MSSEAGQTEERIPASCLRRGVQAGGGGTMDQRGDRSPAPLLSSPDHRTDLRLAGRTSPPAGALGEKLPDFVGFTLPGCPGLPTFESIILSSRIYRIASTVLAYFSDGQLAQVTRIYARASLEQLQFGAHNPRTHGLREERIRFFP